VDGDGDNSAAALRTAHGHPRRISLELLVRAHTHAQHHVFGRNTVSHVIINAIVIVYCVLNMRTWAWASVRFTVNMQTFPTVLGIVVFSYTDHIFLPTLEGNMQDRTQFKPMLKMTHIAAAIFKVRVTYGTHTR
jgi:hypothetical protein